MMTEFIELGNKITEAVMAWLFPCVAVPALVAIVLVIFVSFWADWNE